MENRLPRPSGATYLGQVIYKADSDIKKGLEDPNKAIGTQLPNLNKKTISITNTRITTRDHEKLINLYIQHYIANNYCICGQWLNVEALAKFMDLPITTVQGKVISVLGLKKKHLDGFDMGNHSGVGLFEALNWHHEAQNLARLQALNLTSQQAGKYVPFLSEQASAAIKNYSAIIKTQFDMYKALQPAHPAIQILNQNNQATINNQILGPDEASKMIEERLQSMPIGGTQHTAYLGTKVNLLGLPEIVSTKAQEEDINAKLMVDRAREEAGEITLKEAREMRHQDEIQEEIHSEDSAE